MKDDPRNLNEDPDAEIFRLFLRVKKKRNPG